MQLEKIDEAIEMVTAAVAEIKELGTTPERVVKLGEKIIDALVEISDELEVQGACTKLKPITPKKPAAKKKAAKSKKARK